ncbi:hypothetical protein [Tessaracoccus caeni]|uniref:hypothetical protein n=1 Tax=Tessaracoccus caeni TaxID=3031239 RepID=UPI0023DB412D|nr:hypothetical protein [Tessaracoccus caeni]MDF1487985.1 hypothetical protein [Tessaracoccus caeni]
MRSFKTLSVAAVLVGMGSVLVGASVAFAATEAEQIMESCASQVVCEFDGASISDADALADVLPQGVFVVVIPQPDQAQSTPSGTLASELRDATGADTVIVIEDRATDRFAVSSAHDAVAITESLYTQRQTDGGAAVATIAQSLAPTSPPATPDDVAGGWGVWGVWGLIVPAAVVLAAAGGAVRLLRARREAKAKRKVAWAGEAERELAEALTGENGEFVKQAMRRLDERADALPGIGPRIAGLSNHVAELFIRVRKRGSDQQVRLLQVEYKDVLSKLLGALDDDYYGDIRANPQYWSTPEARLAEVERAVDSVDQQAVENIRQINESRDLDFKVALDSLIKTVNEAKLSDVYRDHENRPTNPRAQG